MECLFAKASTANAGAELLKPSSPGATTHLYLKGHTQKWCLLAHTLKVAILTSYTKLVKNVRYFELKLDMHTQSKDIRDLFYIL